MVNITMKHEKEMSFSTEINGHKLVIDAAEEFGGTDQGPRPKPLILAALAGCTGMDVASMLKKMKVLRQKGKPRNGCDFQRSLGRVG